MIDFLIISTRNTKKGIEVFPKFRLYPKSNDLMIRGGDFYAVWIEELGLWSTDELDALRLIDRELDRYVEEHKHKFDTKPKVLYMWDSESGMIDAWHRYCQRQSRDSYHNLDERLIFSNEETKKKDYASKKLPYPLEQGETPSWDKLMSTLYSPEERHKIEWAIGSIVSGESRKLQKFMVLYGEAGTGKSTVLNIIQKLFEGYYSTFDAKALGSSSAAFALEAFKDNPLVAIQHDGDLSRIEDNTRLNSLVSHERMIINEKFKSQYTNQFKAFLFMGTNKPVKITDGKSGLIRRLIDVSPSGNKLKAREYKAAVEQVDFELGAIAYNCQEIFLEDPGYYDDYIPTAMLGASNDFYNYVLEYYPVFKREDGVSLKAAYEMYKTYCDEAKVSYPAPRRAFQEELKNYFWEYNDRLSLDDGSRVRSYYSRFRADKFEDQAYNAPKEPEKPKKHWLEFNCTKSIFDTQYKDCKAQYTNDEGTPQRKWEKVTSKLSDLDTSKLHYVLVPEEEKHIFIDFDIPDKDGNKCYELNVEEASKWPATYAELSKSGKGVHLHYIYTGDVSQLSRIYDEHIEIKVCSGKSSLRRMLTKCNDLPIATISSGLPLKGVKNLVNFEAIKSEKWLRTMIKKNLNKECHPATKPSVDFIHKLLEDSYNQGLCYDVTDMRNAVLSFAASSTNQADYCIKLVNKMHFKSEDPSLPVEAKDEKIIFYDVEVFPNLLLVNWKVQGEGKPVVRMINPGPKEIESLMRFRLVGFNNRRYDNHILYGRMIGYTNEQIYNLSRRLTSKDKKTSQNAMFSEAYNVSYTDIYDFSSKKQSLKKWEIELGIHHQELGLPWDEPVPEHLWPKVAEYCDNDVIATEAVFNHLKGDWVARQILASVAGMTVNDTTNTLTARIIFDTNRKPQDQFNWRNLADPVKYLAPMVKDFLKENDIIKMPFDDESILPYFPGYKFEFGKSTYRDVVVGEGGCVFAKPDIHSFVALLDIASQHPTSAICEVIFGPTFTKRFKELRDSRVHVKHGDYDLARTMLDGKLAPYLDSDEYTADDLAQALKIAINAVYGMTAASFENIFRDPRNVDNIVAKRGALFMLDLKHEVQKLGYTVAHIKTDSIKVADADPKIIQFIMDFGKKYGYSFEHEATYEKMCLVNDAVYIAKYATLEQCAELYGEEYINRSKDTLKDNKKHPAQWTATGTQFAVPYVFKKLFSKEEIEFDDLCETKSVTSALYLDMNENLPDVTVYENELELRRKATDDPKIERKLNPEFRAYDDEKIKELIEEGHNYKFVGRVGSFCPIKPGCGGGVLLRESVSKKTGEKGYAAATGSKGYRWLEAETVKNAGMQDSVDHGYYIELVDAAVAAISQYGDFEQFASDDPWPILPF